MCKRKKIEMCPPRSLYRIVRGIQCFLEETNYIYAMRKMETEWVPAGSCCDFVCSFWIVIGSFVRVSAFSGGSLELPLAHEQSVSVVWVSHWSSACLLFALACELASVFWRLRQSRPRPKHEIILILPLALGERAWFLSKWDCTIGTSFCGEFLAYLNVFKNMLSDKVHILFGY